MGAEILKVENCVDANKKIIHYAMRSGVHEYLTGLVSAVILAGCTELDSVNSHSISQYILDESLGNKLVIPESFAKVYSKIQGQAKRYHGRVKPFAGCALSYAVTRDTDNLHNFIWLDFYDTWHKENWETIKQYLMLSKDKTVFNLTFSIRGKTNEEVNLFLIKLRTLIRGQFSIENGPGLRLEYETKMIFLSYWLKKVEDAK